MECLDDFHHHIISMFKFVDWADLLAVEPQLAVAASDCAPAVALALLAAET